MTENTLPSAQVRQKEKLSAIWLVPLVALAIGAWLLYQSMISADTLIQVKFDSGEGLKQDKTELRYQGVIIGKVKTIILAEDRQSVVAEIAVKATASDLLVEGTRFWLVKPKVSLQGVSGLDTLLSGQYISLAPGESTQLQHRFTALESAPEDAQAEDEFSLELLSDTLGSLQEGSPIHYRDIAVGKVLRYELDSDNDKVKIIITIDEPYRHLVRENTHFWNNSGFRMEGNLSGLKLRTRSLVSMLMGGISFDVPNGEPEAKRAIKNQQFKLHPDFEAASVGISVFVTFKTAEGLEEGSTQVVYKGLKVGSVRKLHFGGGLDQVTAEISLPLTAKKRLNENTRFWMVKPELSLSGISGLDTLIRGNYIEIDPGKGSTPTFHFDALDEAPSFDPNHPGMRIQLVSDHLADLAQGSPVYYRLIPIGEVLNYQLDKSNKQVIIDLQIQQQYAHLVSSNSRFWKRSALSVQGSLSDIDIQLAPVHAMLAGGIELDNLEQAPSKPIKQNHRFPLYSDRDSAMRQGYKLELLFFELPGIGKGSEIRHRGLKIGEVRSVRLDTRSNRLIATTLIDPQLAPQMTSKSHFWVVGPEFGISKTENLDTLISGAYIGFHPGPGSQARQIIGQEKAPNLIAQSDGLHLTLSADRLGSITKGAPVNYRQITVGEVLGYKLSDQADQVLIHISIEPEYAPLVYQHSRFWNNSGIDFSFKLLTGAKLQTESLETLIAGGISFATPELEAERGSPAAANQQFVLHDKLQESWLSWKPKIDLNRSQ